MLRQQNTVKRTKKAGQCVKGVGGSWTMDPRLLLCLRTYVPGTDKEKTGTICRCDEQNDRYSVISKGVETWYDGEDLVDLVIC